FARIYGFMYFFPVSSGEQVPPMVRAIFCMALTPWIAMPQLADPEFNIGLQTLFYALLVKEAVFGAFMGLLVGLPLRLPEIIGG
ncbi:MAG: flagellar biosynthetic protein FliR, partial [Haliea sp.]|nr:flagellar biosynthetic protein FliR [Haliea sp.]